MSVKSLYGTLKKDSCTIRKVVWSRRTFYLYAPILVIIHAAFYVGRGNVFVLELFKTVLPDVVKGELIPTNAWVAAIVEPFFSKLFPVLLVYSGAFLALLSYAFAIAVSFFTFGLTDFGPQASLVIGIVSGAAMFGFIRFYLGQKAYRCLPTRKHRWLIGALVGMSFGITEVYNKMVIRDGVFILRFWEYPSFTPVFLPPVFLHIFEGTLVVGVFLLVWRNTRYTWQQKAIRIVGSLLVAMAVHVYWNTRFTQTGRGDCIGEWCFWSWWRANFSPELVALIGGLFAFGVWVLYQLDGVETREVNV